MRFFPPDAVELLDGMFRDAALIDLDYVLSLDPDRLAAPFLREAGLPALAEPYGNWESTGLDGHTAGHYVSALAWLALPPGRDEVRRRLDHLVGEISRAQTAIGTGYVGGVPGGVALFEALRAGGIGAARDIGSNGQWVPWYNIHKTISGMLDAAELVDHPQALTVATRFADWWIGLAAALDDDAFEAMLETEFGGMNDAFARLAARTGRPEFADMAARFSHAALLGPLLAGRDELTGLHANTQIPKVVGYASTAAVRKAPDLLTAAEGFWRHVVERRSVAIGGNSVREHFHALDDFTDMIEDREGPESCNTYNMLKLTKALAEARFAPEHLDYAERAIYNLQLSSQHPDGGFVYFTPMRPRHYRVYSQPETSFWCCVGTGMEAQAKYGELIFGEQDDAIAVNLFIPAELDARDHGVRLRLETRFPVDDAVVIEADVEESRRFALRVRVPHWCDGLLDIEVNGRSVEVRLEPGAVVVDRQWAAGDALSFRVPLTLRAEPLPDGSPWQAYSVGPIVLAARAGRDDLAGLHADDSRMGHVAMGRLHALADLPIVAAHSTAPLAADAAEGSLHFRLQPLAGGAPVRLEPFSGIHDERYTVYFPTSADRPPALAARRAELEAMDRRALGDDVRTIDSVALGEQQPEVDHEFRGGETRVAVAYGRPSRATRDRMSVVLRDPDREGATLRVGYRGAEEPARVAVLIDEVVVAEEVSHVGGESFEADYRVTATGRPLRVEFQALDGRWTPSIMTVRLLAAG